MRSQEFVPPNPSLLKHPSTHFMNSKEINRRQALIDKYVSAFPKFDEMTVFETDPVAIELAVGEPNKYGFRKWMPKKVDTDSAQLDQIYEKLPARFPPIFEQLVLSYRWAKVDLGTYRLVANPPGPDLKGLLSEVARDEFMWKHLLRAGYIRFGKGPDMDYDPVCFDLSGRRKNKDYRIVKLDHEQILCNERTKIVAELANGFEELITETIQKALLL